MIKLGTRITVNHSHPFAEYHGGHGRVTSVDLNTNIVTVTMTDGEEVASYVPWLTVRKSTFLRTLGLSLATYGAAAIVLLLAMYGANQATADQSWHGATGEAGSAVPTQDVAEWQEDSLPQALYDWVEANPGTDLQDWSGEPYDGHEGCWAAVADTTLVMCPDGFTTTT
jgi:hypothetical protein